MKYIDGLAIVRIDEKNPRSIIKQGVVNYMDDFTNISRYIYGHRFAEVEIINKYTGETKIKKIRTDRLTLI